MPPMATNLIRAMKLMTPTSATTQPAGRRMSQQHLEKYFLVTQITTKPTMQVTNLRVRSLYLFLKIIKPILHIFLTIH